MLYLLNFDFTWNGSQFNDFGRGFSLFDNRINELAVISNKLYIGGDFSSVLGGSFDNVLLWDGNDWAKMSDGIDGTVLAIEYYNNQIFIGGEFTFAGVDESENISIWKED